MERMQEPASIGAGVLCVDKPPGLTSHDVVDAIRRLFGVSRVGHAGTLDPLATGVLVVLIGRAATRLQQQYMAGEKLYETGLRLGLTTDTLDIDGRVLSEAPVQVTVAELIRVVAGFTGRQLQVPPSYSALKVAGRPLHRYARQGVPVEVPAREVDIPMLEVVAADLPEAVLRCRCSKGTYVRALVRDIGQRLGCGATVTELCRLAASGFRLDQAVSLDTLAGLTRPQRWGLLVPVS